MRFLFVGDVVGTPGVTMLRRAAPHVRTREKLDFIVANVENATNGSGLSAKDYKLLRSTGIEAFTLGDHVYKRSEIATTLAHPAEPIGRPANFPPASPGKDYVRFTVQGVEVVVILLLGRTFMKPVDCPFAAVDRVLSQLTPGPRITIVDMHAEATADKYLIAHHLKGRVTAVLGTHTHVPTADEQIFPGGTAFQCDVGMTGPYEGILGRRVDRVLPTITTFVPHPFDVASQDVRLAGAIVDVDPATGKATGIQRYMLREKELPSV